MQAFGYTLLTDRIHSPISLASQNQIAYEFYQAVVAGVQEAILVYMH